MPQSPSYTRSHTQELEHAHVWTRYLPRPTLRVTLTTVQSHLNRRLVTQQATTASTRVSYQGSANCLSMATVCKVSKPWSCSTPKQVRRVGHTCMCSVYSHIDGLLKQME